MLSNDHHRRLAAVALAVLLAGAAPAREPDPGGLARISVGIKGGPVLAQHQGTEPRESEYTVDSTVRHGLSGGIFFVFPVTPRFALQQEVLYVQKGSRQNIGVDILGIPTVLDVSYEMDYLEIPLLLRYKLIMGRKLDLYTLGGFAFGLKLHDRYRLEGEVTDGEQTIPITADSDMSEVDLFDFAFSYGLGVEFALDGRRFLVEYRFDLSLQQLPLPTYAYVPFGEDDQILIDNDPVPLRSQAHLIMVGLRF